MPVGPPVAEPGFLESHLRARRDAGRKLLVPYLTGGLPRWLDHVQAAVDAGADAVEVGIPFSDPVMDGPTIQEASGRALAGGTTPASVLHDLRYADVGVPVVVMTYVNLVYRMGARRAAAELRDAGVSGVILPDLPLEEQGIWRAAGDAAGIQTVQLASPIGTDQRLRELTAASAGYVYGVNLLGITGERTSLGDLAADLAARLKAVTDLPVVMGFGVGTPQVAAEIAAVSDGVIVGSAIMRRILDGCSPSELGAFVGSLRAALDSV
jgi:tryptophan synthase alpha chain